MELRTVGYGHPDAVAMVAAVQEVYLLRYGGYDSTPVDAAEFAAPAGLFVIGYLGGGPVVCGGWRMRTEPEDVPGAEPEADAVGVGDAELKRMYVVDAARGRGFARGLLAELERTAVEAGARRMVLETGVAQPEAIQLYLSSGYLPIPKFGVYR
ncbi:MAG TPA: GNAT family N-acetyltransferase, partial [Pseudonocardia sp.]|nr:GNAT family N-acetyltransferase [Pseudonocardia sp.]